MDKDQCIHQAERHECVVFGCIHFSQEAVYESDPGDWEPDSGASLTPSE